MTGSRITLILLTLMALTAGTGCITLYHKSETVRGDEQRIPVQFESNQASRLFYEEMKGRKNCVGEEHIGLPLLTLYEKDTSLSENAFFNDQVRICDGNQDRMITEQEAAIYAGKPGPDLKWPPPQPVSTVGLSPAPEPPGKPPE